MEVVQVTLFQLQECGNSMMVMVEWSNGFKRNISSPVFCWRRLTWFSWFFEDWMSLDDWLIDIDCWVSSAKAADLLADTERALGSVIGQAPDGQGLSCFFWFFSLREAKQFWMSSTGVQPMLEERPLVIWVSAQMANRLWFYMMHVVSQKLL